MKGYGFAGASFVMMSMLMLSTSFASAGSLQDDFTARKQEVLDQNTLVWAWCENCEQNFNYYNDLIWQHAVQIWEYQYAERSKRQGQVHMARLRYQYPHCLTNEQIAHLDDFFRGQYSTGMRGVPSPWVANASPNQQINALGVMYLVGENNPEFTSYYDPENATQMFEDFCYQDRCYSKGETYSTYGFARDYLYYIMEKLLEWDTYQNGFLEYPWEMDSRNYFISQIKTFLLLRDLAQNQDMAHKANMMFTLLALNAKMDFSAAQWGGALGRNYTQHIVGNYSLDFSLGMFGDWTSYQRSWEDTEYSEQKWDYPVRYDSQSVSMITPKEYDPLVLEIGNIDQEDNDYAHIHIEKNADHTQWNWVGENPSIRDSANWNYVTKYYNLGGNRNHWILQVRPHSYDPYDGDQSWSFRFWANDDYCKNADGQLLEDCADDTELTHYAGHANIQYKNAIFILDSEQRQIMAPDFYFESRQSVGGWTFYRVLTGEEVNGGTPAEIVVAFKDDNRALEVCTVGVDYPSYDAFKSAILNNAKVDSTGFTTSKGDLISEDGYYNYGLINGEPIWGEYGFPIPDFPLMTTYDTQGNKMIAWDWDSKTLTLRHAGEERSLDFSTWTIDDDQPLVCSEDVNGDGNIDGLDLQMVINALGRSPTNQQCTDLNGDQTTSDLDVQLLTAAILK